MHSVILINPWIYDFAAYDLWSKPLGLLYIAGYLRSRGLSVNVIDCLDRTNPEMLKKKPGAKPVSRKYGTGKYFREEIEKPPAIKHFPRTYSRYGIHPDIYENLLKRIKKPSAIMVSSLMTYWYPGVIDAIAIAKKVHPGVPVILGGIYARLCMDHAKRFSGADYVANEITLENLSSLPDLLAGFDIQVPHRNNTFYPAFDTYPDTAYVCILTSTGCPYSCKYCASNFLYPSFRRREPDEVVDEIEHWHTGHKISDFSFYDDALLVDSKRHIIPILENLKTKGINVRFHTPNALHVKEITPPIAGLLFSSGFKTIRLGLETSDMDMHRDLDKKVSMGDFEIAVKNLTRAGYSKKDIGAYILTGLPGQSIESVAETVKFADRAGAMPYLAEYSPLPETPLWKSSVACSRYDIENDPIFHNNCLLSCWSEEQVQRMHELKKLVKDIRQA